MKLLEKFLASHEPDVVAAAIEAAVELGDPAIEKSLAKLESDARTVVMEDDEGESDTVTLGQLAKEARELVQGEG